jgi:hypothetical protein
MVHRSLLSSTVGQLPQPLPIETDKDGKLTTQSVGAINAFMQNVNAALNGLVSIGDGRQSSKSGNIDGQTVIVVTPATPNAEFEVPHGLERVPIGRIVLTQSGPGQIYDSNRGGWGVRQVFFKCDAASVTFTLILV